jgi:hypothetical protein
MAPAQPGGRVLSLSRRTWVRSTRRDFRGIGPLFEQSDLCFATRDFLGSLKAGKEEADDRVERSLYSRAVGYSFNSEKIFCNKDGEVTRVPIVEHVPPDVTAQIFWLKNRDPAHWRDAWQMEHVTGKYIISDRPMTEEEWIRERAVVIDVTPEKADK